MRLGSVINTCETADELSRCLGGSKVAEGKAKMESIKPALGPGLPGSQANVLSLIQQIDLIQGDPYGQLEPPVDLGPTAPAADWPLLLGSRRNLSD